MEEKNMDLNNSELLNTILVSIDDFKKSKECPEFIQNLSITSKQFKKEIIKNAAIKPEILKMRIGF